MATSLFALLLLKSPNLLTGGFGFRLFGFVARALECAKGCLTWEVVETYGPLVNRVLYLARAEHLTGASAVEVSMDLGSCLD